MNRKKKSKLQALYNQVPSSNCKGLCTNQCTIIGMAKGEWDNLVQETGKEPAIRHDGSCIYLVDGKCSVYDSRPLICRLYGSVDHELLKCEYGCKPDKILSNFQSDKLIREVEKLCGDGPGHISNKPPKIA